MSKVVRRRKSIQKNRFKTVFIVLIVAVCLFIIYKFNFTTKSEIEVTTPVKFKEFEGENEILANIPVLEDENGKYIILPDKVNGIFTSAYYLSDDEIKKVNKNTNTSNTSLDNTINTNTAEGVEKPNTNNKNEIETNENKINQNTVSTNTTNSLADNTLNKDVENKVSTDSSNETADNVASEIQENAQIEPVVFQSQEESLFTRATKNTEEYADMLEEIAENSTQVSEENSTDEESSKENSTNETSTSETNGNENNETSSSGASNDTETTKEQTNEETPVQTIAEEQTQTGAEQNQETTENTTNVPETGNLIITEKEQTLPGEKYYLSEEELENEDISLSVSFQTVEINGQKLYNQELTADMIDTIIKLTCYTPLGYYLDVKEEDVNKIQELKLGAEEIEESETVFAYDIKITNGEEEFQPEEYYQVATVSITKPETIDFKTNSQSLQLLHIKETEDTIDFQKIPMSKVESDSFEFLTNEFSIYAVIMYAAITDEQITINDYEADYNYYMGKNYTDNDWKYNPTYTDENLAQVIINYHGNSVENKILEEGQKNVIVNTIIDKTQTESFSTSNLTLESYTSTLDYTEGWWYRDYYGRVFLTFSLDDIVPDTIPDNSTFTLAPLNLSFSTSYSLINSQYGANNYTRNGNNITSLTVNASDYDRNTNTITVSIAVMGSRTGEFNPTVEVSSVTLNGTRYHAEYEYEKYNYRTEITDKDSGYVSATERQNVVSYVKCVPVINGNINIELIDNPFMDRVVAKTNYYAEDDTDFSNPLTNLNFESESILFGFNGWENATGQNYSITCDSQTKVQTLTAPYSSKEAITIDLYVDWKVANTVYISRYGSGTGDGSSINNTLSCSSLSTAVTKLKSNGIVTATNASNRELNIIVLVGGTVSSGNFSTSNCAYTLTSLYNGVDYRNSGAILSISSSTSLDNDLQLSYLNFYNTGNYKTIGTGTYYMDANSYNLRIGRGMQPLNDIATFGAVHGGLRNNTKSKVVIETGNYAQIFTISGRSSTTGNCYREVIIGNDYDRINGDNDSLYVYDRFHGRTTSGVVSKYDGNSNVYKSYVKSGTIGIGCFENQADDDAFYSGVYLGGSDSSTTSSTYDAGDRTTIIEGGNISNVIGGLYILNTNRYDTYIFVKGGNIINIVGGAGYTHTYGDRKIQVTGGYIKNSIAGGSNGFKASSSSNNGQLTGESYIYVGGNTQIGASSTRNSDGTETVTITDPNNQDNYLYGVKPGCVCGGANGNANYKGQTEKSHIIIDGDAIVYGDVYGGGNYGFIEPETTETTIPSTAINTLVSGKYIIGTNDGAMYYRNTSSIGFGEILDQTEYYWTIEMSGTNTFYIKYGNNYIVTNEVNSISYSSNISNATEFTYNANRKISYTYRSNRRNRTAYLYINNNSTIGLTTSSSTGSIFYFMTGVPKVEKDVVVSIDILGGKIKSSVFGGANQNKIGGCVSINVLGGTVEGTIYGGSNTSGNIEGDVDISIEGGNIGLTQTQDTVFGGGYGTSTKINKNVNITIKDTSNNINVLGNVYGGGSLGNILGTTNINVEDHYSGDYNISIIGNIFGGGKGIYGSTAPTSSGNVTVNVDGGTYENLDVYGGYNANGTIPNSNVLVNIGENYKTKINDIYGGGNQANIANTTTSVIVKMYQNAIVNNAYNGGNNAGINGTNTREIYAIGATVGNLFGGSNNYGALEFSNVYVSDSATIGNVFGGGNKAEITTNTNVDITDSEVTENVYGGGNQASVGTYTDVDINNSTINRVYGGGNAGTVAYTANRKPVNENTTNVDIINGSTIETVYGGGCSAAIGANSNIYVENSTITNIFGGGEGENAIVVGTTNINTNGLDTADQTGKVTILGNIYGGGDLGKVNENTIITVSKTDIVNSIFGGGNQADVELNTAVTISKSTAGTVYGGGMNGAVGGATAVSIIEDSIITNNVFGGGSKGDVTGNTVVNLDNSKVTNDLFGGGEAAKVNGTTVSLTNASEVRNAYGGGDNGITVSNTSVALKSVTVHESAFGAGNGAPAIVRGKSYIYADGTTTIGKSLFAGGNNSATGTTDTNPNKDLDNKPIEKATAVADIAGATIEENVYGGANTSVIYGDTVINIGNEAIKTYYNSINASVPNYVQGKVYIGGTIYGGGEQMDPNKEYNYDTVSVEGYIKININGNGYDTADNSMHIAGSIFGSGHASRAGLPTSYVSTGNLSDTEETGGYITINGDVDIKNYGSVKAPKSMVSIQRCGTVVVDKSALWISGATDSTNVHSTTYFSFNHIDALKMKNDSTLYLRATSNLLKSYYSLVDIDGKEEKAEVEIVNEITGADGNTYDAIGNYIYGLTGNIKYVIKSGQIFTADNDGNALELVTDVKNSKTKSVNKNTDNRIYMYSGLNLNISTDENLGDDTWGPVEGMTFFGIFNTTNTAVDKDDDVDISQTTDTNNDFSTIHTGIYDVNYQVSDTINVNWKDRDFNRSYVEGKHVKSPQEQDIQIDGFYTNYEKFGIEYGDDEEIEESNYAEHNPTSYTDYIIPTPDETNYYIWYAGPDQDFYYYNLALIASKLSTYGTVEKTLQGISAANATFKITGVDSSLTHGAVLYDKSKIQNINTTGNPNREFALAMKTGATGWSMNGETNFTTSPNVDFSGTETYKTENSNMTPSLGFYLYHSNNISDETELGFFTINMMLYYWKTPTQQARARVTIDVAINTKVYDDLGYDASITPGRQYELFPRTTTNITTKSSFSAYFQLYEKDFANNSNLQKFFTKPGTGADAGTDVVDTDAINRFINENYRVIKTDYVFPEDTTITMIDKSTDNPTYYYYTVTASDVANKKKTFRLSEFRKMGSTSENQATDTAEYYLDSYRDSYVTTVNENGTNVTYQSETFIFIVDFESSKFVGIDNMYEVVKNQAFNLVLTSDVKNADGEALEISILEEYKERNSISFGIYNTDSTIEIAATISPNKIYLGDSTDISIETNYIVENKDASDITKVYDTRYFDSKLGVKITIYDEAGNIVHGANLLGAYFKITEADGTTTLHYPRTDGTTRMKIADKVSNSKATITFETAKSTLPTGKYTFLVESFGSADGVYFGVESSDSTQLNLSIINDEFGLESEIPENYVIIDKETGYTLEDTTGFTVEREYEILDEDGNVIGDTTEELNDGKNDFEYSVKYSSGYEKPYIAVALYRRNYDSVYDRTYSLVDLADYLNVDLDAVPDDIKEQFAITTYDVAGNPNPDKKYVGYEAYGIDFINKAVQDAINSSTDVERPIIKLTTKCSLKDKLVSGTYKLVFTLYDKTEVEKLIETVNPDGTITAEMQTVTEYQRIGDTFSYMIIK